MANRPKLSLLFTVTLIFLAFARGGWADEEVQNLPKSKGGFDFSLSNNVGAATFLQGNKRTSKFFSNFSLAPYYKTPEVFSNKIIKFSGDLGMDVDWINSGNISPSDPSRTPKVTDLLMRASMPRLLDFSQAGLAVTPAIETEVPVSAASLNANRVLALGASVDTQWTKGGLSVNYKPTFMGYFHSVPYKSSLCTLPTPADSKRPRILADGRCLVDGQQTLSLLKNALALEYVLGPHTFTGLVRTYHSFLRTPDISDDKTKTSSSYLFSTLGVVEYSYTLPVAFTTYLILGLSSYQAAFSSTGALKFPFFDFEAPANSEFYFKITLSV